MTERLILINIDDIDEGYSRDNPCTFYIKTNKTSEEIDQILEDLQTKWDAGEIEFQELSDTVEYKIGENVGIEEYEVQV